MWSVLALGAAESLINRIIDLDAITRLKLDELQGQCLRVVIDAPSLSVDVCFDAQTIRFEPTALGQATAPSLFEQRPFDPQYIIHEVTATLHVKDMVELVKLITTADEDVGNIPLQGDYHLLFALQEILAQVELDIAAHLSPWIGATLAHEIGKLQRLPQQLFRSGKSAEFMLFDSLKEDAGIFAPRWQMNDLQQQTRQLNREIDRLEAQTQQLLAQLGQHLPSAQQD